VWVPEGISFNGTTSYVEIPSTDAFNGTGLTIVARVSYDDLGTTYPRIVDRRYNGQFSLYCSSGNNELSWALSTDGGDVDLASGSEVEMPAAGTPFIAALTYDKVAARTYINGVLGQTRTAGIGGGLSSSSDIIRIGQRVDGSNGAWDGLISYVSIWNRALSPSLIQSLYADPYALIRRPTKTYLYYTAPDGHAYQDLSFDLSVASALTSDRILVESAVGSTSVTTKKALTSDRLRLTT